jgi:UDP-N-acetylglucosamine--N-acetylmuramyl-(pentapeptide) pyrophosphoryl-undecaprenol N-acetylglucosamine transferase
VIADAALTPERLRAEIDAILGDPERLAAMAAASAALARPDAARDVARAVLAAARPPRLPETQVQGPSRR